MLKSRSVGLLMLLLGLVTPTVGVSLEAAAETRTNIVQAQQVQNEAATEAVAERVNIEERLEFVPGEPREYTFVGNANEVVVVYTEFEASPWGNVRLFSPEGERVRSVRSALYSEFSELEGQHYVFSLPDTGEYRVVFSSYAPLPSALLPEAGEPDPDDRDGATESLFLKVRLASYYERVLIAGEKAASRDDLDRAFDLFSQAIEQEPDAPGGYLRRLLLVVDRGYETAPDNKHEMTPMEIIAFSYQQLVPEQQRIALEDLRQLEVLAIAALEREEFTLETSSDDDGLRNSDVSLLSDLADFLETGTASAPLLELINRLEG